MNQHPKPTHLNEGATKGNVKPTSQTPKQAAPPPAPTPPKRQ
ncbi:MAG: hypothetical protein HW421_3250 [Ignavibacteria bacterium]|nr:hypothetical protein [Ignavibacteria bacterium]